MLRFFCKQNTDRNGERMSGKDLNVVVFTVRLAFVLDMEEKILLDIVRGIQCERSLLLLQS